MPFDGTFIHYLTNELNEELQEFKVNKIYQPNVLDVVLQLRGKNKTGLIVNKQLLISSSLDSPRIYLTNDKFHNPENPSNFCMLLRKYVERGYITNIKQYLNDRVIIIEIKNTNEMQDEYSNQLIIEIMGKNSNIILADNDFSIIDAIRKLPPIDEHSRTILPHAKYLFPETRGLLSPFDNPNLSMSSYMGMSRILQSAIKDSNQSVSDFINQPLNPLIYKRDEKLEFYAYKLHDDDKIVGTYLSLSSCLNDYYHKTKATQNYDTSNLLKVMKKAFYKVENRKENFNTDLIRAKEELKKENEAILLQSNLYLVKPGDKKVNVFDFLNTQTNIDIELDPMLDASGNLKKMFKKIKKAKNAIVKLDEQIKLADEEIRYLEDILFQIEIADAKDISEIKSELITNGYLKSTKKIKRNQAITILCYEVQGTSIFVGKNNKQNEYLTHKLAKKNDYWFHVKDAPGSHVIVRMERDTEFNEPIIRAAANLAAYYSKAQTSGSVPVDYTMVKYIKKIPGEKGYHVTFTNQSTIYIDPDPYLIKTYKCIKK